MNRFQFLRTLIAVGAVAAAIGCIKPNPKPAKPEAATITLELDSSLSRVDVDLVGMNPAQRGQWTSKSMTEYWGDSDKLRSGVRKKTVTLTKDTPNFTLEAKDSIWQQWLKEDGAAEVVVLADLPDMATKDDREGAADPRRRILSLNPKDNPAAKGKFRVTVKRAGLEVGTDQAPR